MSFDILSFRYFAFDIFYFDNLRSIFWYFDILRLRYFATSIFCFRYFAFDILPSIFFDSIFCFSIFICIITTHLCYIHITIIYATSKWLKLTKVLVTGRRSFTSSFFRVLIRYCMCIVSAVNTVLLVQFYSTLLVVKKCRENNGHYRPTALMWRADNDHYPPESFILNAIWNLRSPPKGW